MITIKAVPTRTPTPIVETIRNRDGDMENDRGNEPARKDLTKQLAWASTARLERHSRNGHDGAQGEQHEKTIQHLDRGP